MEKHQDNTDYCWDFNRMPIHGLHWLRCATLLSWRFRGQCY